MTERFEQIPTEMMSVVEIGIVGDGVRVLMRSATEMLYVSYGLNLWKRGSAAFAHRQTIISGRVTIAKLSDPVSRAKIVETFGVGADEAAILAWRTRGVGTILVDGGGKGVREPGNTIRDKDMAARAAVTPETAVDLHGELKTCLQCGTDLRPHQVWHSMGPFEVENHPTSLADCQRMTNQRVIAVRGYNANHPDFLHLVESFQTWDGEHYNDPEFCDDRCAAKYGRRAALEREPLVVGEEPRPRTFPPHEHHEHFERRAETITLQDGTKFRI